MISKPVQSLLSVILLLNLFIGCKREKDSDSENNQPSRVTATKTDVKTFEVVSVVAKESLSAKYAGTFGGQSVELIKTSDTTLSFVVPDVPVGEHVLKSELSNLKFQVSKTQQTDANQLVTVILDRFDTKIAALNPITQAQKAEVDSMKRFKERVLALYNSLTEEQKKQTAQIYNANKEAFTAFVNNVSGTFDAPTSMGKQSSCPRTDYKAFYDCTSSNLATSYTAFKQSTGEFTKMVAMAGGVGLIAIKLSAMGPIAIGLTAVAMAPPLATAIYLFVADVWPAWVTMRDNTYEYLKAPWIFREELFNNLKGQFNNEVNTDLNLDAGFRTVSGNDNNVTPNTGRFIGALADIKTYWDKFSSLFGTLPDFLNSKNSITLAASDIQITNISNPNVQMIGQVGEEVKFKTTSGNEESFNYHIRVAKQGFVLEKDASGKVLAIDSTEIYKAAVLGRWTVAHYDPNNPSTSYQLELLPNGIGKYTVPNNPTIYQCQWRIVKSADGYKLYESGFWHPAYDNLSRTRLSYPITSFKVFSNFDANFVSQVYSKN